MPSNQVEVLHNIVVGFYLPRVEAALGDLKVGRVPDGTPIVSAVLAAKTGPLLRGNSTGNLVT